MHFNFIDIEDLYFPNTDSSYIYASSRTHEEVKRLLFNKIQEYNNFVLASVKGEYGESFYPFFKIAILMQTPRNVRAVRIKNRSFQKFGERVLPGGELFEQEEHFFQSALSKNERDIEQWVSSAGCALIRVDGTKAIDKNIDFIMAKIEKNYCWISEDN